MLKTTADRRQLVETLVSRNPNARQHLARNVGAYRTPEVCRGLIDRAAQLRFTDPAEMVSLCKLAVILASLCHLPPEESHLLQAEALTELGNALKVAGRFRASERIFLRAQKLLSGLQGPRPELRANLLERLAALRTRQGRIGESLPLLREALGLRQKSGGRHEIASVLVQMAIALNEVGRHGEALNLLSDAVELIDLDLDPKLGLIARHNGIVFLVEMGRPRAALAIYETILPLYDIAADPIMRLRQKWLGATIAAAFGRAETDAVAEREYRAATAEAISMSLHYEAAKLLLEQGIFYAARRRYALLPRILEEVLPLFAALGIGREHLAVKLMQRATREHAGALALLRRASARLTALRARKIS
jgi:tetratricopeptide (TPR) repeat protein